MSRFVGICLRAHHSPASTWDRHGKRGRRFVLYCFSAKSCFPLLELSSLAKSFSRPHERAKTRAWIYIFMMSYCHRQQFHLLWENIYLSDFFVNFHPTSNNRYQINRSWLKPKTDNIAPSWSGTTRAINTDRYIKCLLFFAEPTTETWADFELGSQPPLPSTACCRKPWMCSDPELRF